MGLRRAGREEKRGWDGRRAGWKQIKRRKHTQRMAPNGPSGENKNEESKNKNDATTAPPGGVKPEEKKGCLPGLRQHVT